MPAAFLPFLFNQVVNPKWLCAGLFGRGKNSAWRKVKGGGQAMLRSPKNASSLGSGPQGNSLFKPLTSAKGIPSGEPRTYFCSFLYRILCGAASPSRFFLFSSYSE
jgi:hypothetical protein